MQFELTADGSRQSHLDLNAHSSQSSEQAASSQSPVMVNDDSYSSEWLGDDECWEMEEEWLGEDMKCFEQELNVTKEDMSNQLSHLSDMMEEVSTLKQNLKNDQITTEERNNLEESLRELNDKVLDNQRLECHLTKTMKELSTSREILTDIRLQKILFQVTCETHSKAYADQIQKKLKQTTHHLNHELYHEVKMLQIDVKERQEQMIMMLREILEMVQEPKGESEEMVQASGELCEVQNDDQKQFFYSISQVQKLKNLIRKHEQNRVKNSTQVVQTVRNKYQQTMTTQDKEIAKLIYKLMLQYKSHEETQDKLENEELKHAIQDRQRHRGSVNPEYNYHSVAEKALYTLLKTEFKGNDAS